MLDVATVAPPIDLDDPAAPGSRSAVDVASDDDGLAGWTVVLIVLALICVAVGAVALVRARRKATRRKATQRESGTPAVFNGAFVPPTDDAHSPQHGVAGPLALQTYGVAAALAVPASAQPKRGIRRKDRKPSIYDGFEEPSAATATETSRGPPPPPKRPGQIVYDSTGHAGAPTVVANPQAMQGYSIVTGGGGGRARSASTGARSAPAPAADGYEVVDPVDDRVGTGRTQPGRAGTGGRRSEPVPRSATRSSGRSRGVSSSSGQVGRACRPVCRL